MKTVYRLLPVVMATLLLSNVASAYSYYVRYNTRSAPFTPIYEKLDLTGLINKTVHYYVNDQGPSQFAPGDTFPAVLSQIRLAAKAWNDVESSDLRLSFGGLIGSGISQSTPGIDVMFDDDIPPGLAALGAPTSRADFNGQFVPITRSVLRLRRDIRDSPSYGEGFFLTLVHEFGHTLGLQHSLASSVMSTGITRGTSKSKPLAPDDVAGISLLYPARNLASSTGSITGRVTLNGDGVNLVSVVAISPNGPAISALTNPDGSYRIDAIPPNNYYVYVHSLPPALVAQGEVTPANIAYPKGPDGLPIREGPGIDTVFYPGTKDYTQATPMGVSPGGSSDGTNFAVQRRENPQLHSVQSYGIVGPNFIAVKSPPIVNNSRLALLVTGAGLVANNTPVSGLNVGVIGGVQLVQGGLRILPSDPRYLLLDFNPTSGGDGSPRHLYFTLNGELYVLPYAFNLTVNQPPSITSVTATFDPATGAKVAFIGGTNLSSGTRILFDGVSAQVKTDSNGNLLVTPPPATSGYRSSVVALNADGQSSLFFQPTPPVFNYDPAGAPSFTGSLPALPAGTETLVDITTANTNFVDGQTTLGFGNSDIVVRRIWVVSPTRILANVSVAPNAQNVTSEVTVASGFQVLAQPLGLQIQPQNLRQINILPGVVNAATGQPGISAGGTGILTVSNPTAQTGLTLLIADQRATILSVSGSQITFQVPSAIPPGPAKVALQTATGDFIYPVLINIDAPLPVVAAVLSGSTVLDSSHSARPGDLLQIQLTGLADAVSTVTPERIRITVAGIDTQAVSVNQSPSQPGAYLVQFFLPVNTPSGPQVPLTLTIDSRTSQPFAIPVR